MYCMYFMCDLQEYIATKESILLMTGSYTKCMGQKCFWNHEDIS